MYVVDGYDMYGWYSSYLSLSDAACLLLYHQIQLSCYLQQGILPASTEEFVPIEAALELQNSIP